MKLDVPEHMASIIESHKNAVCDMLSEPGLWSDTMIKRTLQRGGAQPFNIEDVRSIVKDYLTVLSDSLRKGETI